jgi:hypothetical protein
MIQIGSATLESCLRERLGRGNAFQEDLGNYHAASDTRWLPRRRIRQATRRSGLWQRGARDGFAGGIVGRVR